MNRRALIDRIAGHDARPPHLRIAALAVVIAVATATGSIAIGGRGPALLELAFVITAVAALRYPAAIVALVVVGLMMVGGLLARLDGGARVPLVALMAGVVLTAELLAIAGRLDGPVERDPGTEPRRAIASAGIAAAVFAIVLLAGRLPGPSGVVAVAIASAACFALGILLSAGSPVRDSDQNSGAPTP